MLYAPPVDSTPRVKMEDVARTAGVSVATVSKVVNGRYGVAAGDADPRAGGHRRARLRVEPRGTQSLRSHRTNVLGILVAEFEPFSAELLKGASSAVGATGYELLAYSGGAAAPRRLGAPVPSRLSGTLIDGAIIVTPTVVEADTGVPVVADRPAHRPDRPADRRLRQLRRRASWRPSTSSGSVTGGSASSADAPTWRRPPARGRLPRGAGRGRRPRRPGPRRASAATAPTAPTRPRASCSPRRPAHRRSSPPTTSRRSR